MFQQDIWDSQGDGAVVVNGIRGIRTKNQPALFRATNILEDGNIQWFTCGLTFFVSSATAVQW